MRFEAVEQDRKSEKNELLKIGKDNKSCKQVCFEKDPVSALVIDHHIK